jgi:hypothetical protein
MLSDFPFANAVVRMLLCRKGPWIGAVLIGLLLSIPQANHSQESFPLIMGMAALLAVVTAWRCLEDDHASGTLEQYDVLPMSRVRMAVELACGLTGAFTALTIVVAACSARRFLFEARWDLLLAVFPAVLGCGLLGTLPALRHRMSWPAFAVALLGANAMLYGVIAVLGSTACSPYQLGSVAGAGIATLLVVAAWRLTWAFFEAIGGGWTGRAGAGAVRVECAGGPGDAAVRRERLTPDWMHPLLWREFKTGTTLVVFMLVLGAAHVLCGMSSAYRHDQPAARAAGLSCMLFFWASMASGMRTSRDRVGGVWGDLALTPLSRWSIVWARAVGIATQALVMAVGWNGVASLTGDVPTRRDDLMVILVVVLSSGTCALSGFFSGTSGAGVIAGLGGVFLLYILMLVAMMPLMLLDAMSWWLGFGRNLSKDPLVGAVMALLVVVIFYGLLIGGSMGGIRKAVEDPRV